MPAAGPPLDLAKGVGVAGVRQPAGEPFPETVALLESLMAAKGIALSSFHEVVPMSREGLDRQDGQDGENAFPVPDRPARPAHPAYRLPLDHTRNRTAR